MSILFKQSKITGEERSKCLAFLEEVTKLMIFQENEIMLHDGMRAKWLSGANESPKEILEAKHRLWQAAQRLSDSIYKSYYDYSEKDNAHYVKPSMPSVASKCISAWIGAFGYFLGATSLGYISWQESCRGLVSFPAPEIQEKLTKSAMCRTVAIKEMDKLFMKLNLSDEEKAAMRTKATKIISSEKWYPYW